MTTNTPFSIRERISYFESIEGYFTGDKKLYDFIKSEIGNESLETVMTKVAAIGNPTLWENGGQDAMSSHIHSLKIDDRLRRGDLTVVMDIGNFESITNPDELYHFASKYCCYHFPDLFPIYCSSGHKIANVLAPNPRQEITNHYDWYSEMIELAKAQLGLTSLNYLELNKFLWLYEDQILNRVKVSALSKSRL